MTSADEATLYETSGESGDELDLVLDRDVAALAVLEDDSARKGRIDTELEALDEVLRSPVWDQYTAGQGFIRVLRGYVASFHTDAEPLRRFVNETFDAKRGKFRPYRISQHLKGQGVKVSNHTALEMLDRLKKAAHGSLAGAGASRVGVLRSAVDDDDGGGGGGGGRSGAGRRRSATQRANESSASGGRGPDGPPARDRRQPPVTPILVSRRRKLRLTRLDDAQLRPARRSEIKNRHSGRRSTRDAIKESLRDLTECLRRLHDAFRDA